MFLSPSVIHRHDSVCEGLPVSRSARIAETVTRQRKIGVPRSGDEVAGCTPAGKWPRAATGAGSGGRIHDSAGRHWPGERPTTFLKARLNAASDA